MRSYNIVGRRYYDDVEIDFCVTTVTDFGIVISHELGNNITYLRYASPNMVEKENYLRFLKERKKKIDLLEYEISL